MTEQKDDVKKTDDSSTDDKSKEKEASPDPKSEDKKSDDGSSKGVDYKAELEKERKAREKAEHAAEGYRKKLRGKKKDTDDDAGGDDIDTKDIEAVAEKRAAEIAKEQIEQFSGSLISDVVDEGVDALSSSADEAQLIRHHYDNTIQKSGHSRSAILRDLRRCKLLANESILQKENNELLATLESERGKNKSGQPTGQRKAPPAKVVLTAEEEVLAQRMAARSAISVEEARKKLFASKQES